jgi:hypothetical protein
MSQASFVDFLRACREDARLLNRYDRRDLAQLLFHARNDGYDFTVEDAEAVIGALEYDLITNRDGEPFDGSSRLWRHMWGMRYLGYLVAHVVSRYTDAELLAFGRAPQAVAS